MATAQMDTVIRHLRRAVLRQDEAGWTDGQLLASFLDQKDEAAFEALVRRHGPMVFGVCRRVVGNHHDAEDAFQATFLVLARKASSVRPRERVANWLHGVALRTAMKAKTMTAKRRGREKQVTEMPEPQAAQQDQWRDLQPLLDQELNGLPENYRLPILLCDLEGKTIKDAAKQLGWPQGSLAGRLARGRKLLAKRLANRGVVLSAGSLAAVVSQNVASAVVPTLLMSSTIEAATMVAGGQAMGAGVVPAKVAALMEGVMKIMMLTKLSKAVAGLVVLGAVVFGGGLLLTHYSEAAQPSQALNAASDQKDAEKRLSRNQDFLVKATEGKRFVVPTAPDFGVPVTDEGKRFIVPVNESEEKKPKPKGDMEKLQGTWRQVTGGFSLYPDVPGIGLAENLKNTEIVIDGDGWTGWTTQGKKEKTTFRLDSTTTPKALDVKDRAGKEALGIYMLGEDDLVIYICGGNKQERPTKFVVDRVTVSFLIYKRIRNKDEVRAKPTEKDAAQIEIDTWLDNYYQALGLSRAQVDNPNAEKKDELQGGWILLTCKQDGKAVSKEKQKLWTGGLEQINFIGKFCTQVQETNDPTKKAHTQMEYTMDPSKDPKWLDLSPPKGQVPEGFEINSLKWIYAVHKDELRIGLGTETLERPTGFAMPKTLILTFGRMKQAEIQQAPKGQSEKEPAKTDSPKGGERKDWQPGEAQFVCEEFTMAMFTSELERAMKLVAVPWFDDGEKGGGRVIAGMDNLQDALKKAMAPFKEKAKEKVTLEVIDEFAYEQVPAKLGDKIPAAERALLDKVLKKTDRVVSAQAVLDGERSIRILIFVGLRDGQAKVIGIKDDPIKMDPKAPPREGQTPKGGNEDGNVQSGVKAEVGATPPSMTLYQPELGRGPQAGKVTLTWLATPKTDPYQDIPAKATEGKRFVVPKSLDFGFLVQTVVPKSLDFGFPVQTMEGKRFLVPVKESKEEYRIPIMAGEEEYRVPVITGEGKCFVVPVTGK